CMSTGFVDDIGGRGIFDVCQLADISSDDEHVVCLEFHKSHGRNEPIDSGRPPTDFSKTVIHGLQVGDTLNTQSGSSQAGDIGVIGHILEVTVVLAHHIAPHGVVYRRVSFIMLLHQVLFKVERKPLKDRVSVSIHHLFSVRSKGTKLYRIPWVWRRSRTLPYVSSK